MLALAVALVFTTSPSPHQNVPVYSGDFMGSGVLVQPQLVLTASHIVNESYDGTVSVRCLGLPTPGVIVNNDPKTDLVLIELAEPCDAPVSTLSATNPSRGTDVTALGCPATECGYITRGVVSAYVTNAGETYLSTDAKIFFGNSGGGLFNLNNELVGICSRIDCKAQGGVQACFGLFVPVSTILAFLKSTGR